LVPFYNSKIYSEKNKNFSIYTFLTILLCFKEFFAHSRLLHATKIQILPNQNPSFQSPIKKRSIHTVSVRFFALNWGLFECPFFVACVRMPCFFPSAELKPIIGSHKIGIEKLGELAASSRYSLIVLFN
jgi:hypothetical protein